MLLWHFITEAQQSATQITSPQVTSLVANMSKELILITECRDKWREASLCTREKVMAKRTNWNTNIGERTRNSIVLPLHSTFCSPSLLTARAGTHEAHRAIKTHYSPWASVQQRRITPDFCATKTRYSAKSCVFVARQKLATTTDSFPGHIWPHNKYTLLDRVMFLCRTNSYRDK